MKNKFGAPCSLCGKSVAPGAGQTNMFGGKWVTKHDKCPTSTPRQARPVNHGSYTDFAHGDGCYEMYGMDDADFRSAVNPDEGDR